MDPLPNLPIEPQYLESVIKGNAIYVDKTEIIYYLCSSAGSQYLLFRPRCFGKFSALDTLNELFLWDMTDTYPIIHIKKSCFNVERACLYENAWINADLGKNLKVLVSDTRLS